MQPSDIANYLINLPAECRYYVAREVPPKLVAWICVCGIQKYFQTIASFEELKTNASS